MKKFTLIGLVLLSILFSSCYDRKYDPKVIQQIKDRDTTAYQTCLTKLTFKPHDVVRIKNLKEEFVIEYCSCGDLDIPRPTDEFVGEYRIDNPQVFTPECYLVNEGFFTTRGYKNRIRTGRNGVDVEFLELVKRPE